MGRRWRRWRAVATEERRCMLVHDLVSPSKSSPTKDARLRGQAGISFISGVSTRLQLADVRVRA
eukprot:6351874-Prymnesium_polylepis.1